ncbi:PadR family transcriptional regulator [Herbiconiux daphne]|uniref:PadR family transcriptional regulator n=1 Tax=Herbiconiux daphne TaxID=2970914 RepID=A0ABT2H2D8_9MICO|nr:PadR family transcriptional regulator [Herbiconiux daphne]MCS5734075.1 PadR family transcriptional regulator [Herbiconiux daphne]
MEPLHRVTAQTVDVLALMLQSPEPLWGLQIVKTLGRPSGTVYPILERLERQGWIRSSWAEHSEVQERRRRLYEFTADGADAARELCRAQGRL